jgi:fumarate reductase flavoprotein subunit
VHYTMGGIHTDLEGATPLAGLFAAGETACVNINGANRLGSNSLTELLVFGSRAGRAAAEYAESASAAPATVLAQGLDEEERLARLVQGRHGGERVADVRKEVQSTMEASAGIYRHEEGLRGGLDRIEKLRERLAGIALDDHSRTFNTELVQYLELENLVDLARAILRSGLERRESRGAHQRTDHPARDDDRFLAHTMCHHQSDGGMRVDFLPVTITRWPPAERVYGR